MAHQHQTKVAPQQPHRHETTRTPNQPQNVVPLSFSPATVMHLQRSVGNQATQRLLVDDSAAQVQRKPSPGRNMGVPGIQRDPTKDNPLTNAIMDVDSENFWAQSLLKVKVDFNSWLDRVESILNQFGRDMGGQTKSSTWVKTALKWVGKATGTGTVIEVLSTAKEIYDTLEADSKSVSDFTNEVVQKHNAKRRQLESEDQSLPVFKQIADRMTQEKAKHATASPERKAFRVTARDEILQALKALPSEQNFLQELILGWIRSSEDSYDILDNDVDAGEIVYKTNFLIDQRDKTYTKYRELDTYMGRYAKSDQHIAYLEDVANPKATIKVLNRAFGPQLYLHALPLKFHLIIRGDVIYVNEKGTYREGMPGDYPFEVHYVKNGSNWSLYDGHNDPGLLGWWLGNGKKLTVADLQPE